MLTLIDWLLGMLSSLLNIQITVYSLQFFRLIRMIAFSTLCMQMLLWTSIFVFCFWFFLLSLVLLFVMQFHSIISPPLLNWNRFSPLKQTSLQWSIQLNVLSDPIVFWSPLTSSMKIESNQSRFAAILRLLNFLFATCISFSYPSVLPNAANNDVTFLEKSSPQ